MEQPSLSEVNKFFTLLRPYCIRLIDKPSTTSVAAFNAAISVVDDQVVQHFQEYLLIEISEVLSVQCARSKVVPEFITDYVLCMQNILCRTEIRTWELFNRIITKIIMFLMKHGTDDKINLSDELEMASVKCINEAMKRSTISVLEKVYSDEFLTKLGCILFHLQQLFENEKCRELKILSMECLRSFITIFFESSLKNRLQDPLATFVPGISIALVNVASSSHGTMVVVTAIKTWTDLLVGVTCHS